MAKSSKTSASPLVTHHVFLDTQVYRSMGHNLDSPLLVTLRDQIATDRLVLHITDITLAEIFRQLASMVGDAANSMKDARRHFSVWQDRLSQSLPGDFPEFDQVAVANAASEEFKKRLVTEWRVVEHQATAVASPDIFKDYFRREPPFQSLGSKEFPDAFVVRALDNWCVQEKIQMYVIGADKAMAAAADKSFGLLHTQSLPELLESLAATETPDIAATADILFRSRTVWNALTAEIEGKLDELVPVYVGSNLADGEVSSHQINGEMEIEDFTVVAASKQDMSVVMKIRIPLKVTIDFENRSSAFYDKEDDVYLFTEAEEADIEEETVIKVFTKLIRRPRGVSGVQLITREFEVNDADEYY